MNPHVHPRSMKIDKMRCICKGSPPQGLSEARRGQVFSGIFLIWSLIRRGGVPTGAAVFIVIEDIEVKTSHQISLHC